MQQISEIWFHFFFSLIQMNFFSTSFSFAINFFFVSSKFKNLEISVMKYYSNFIIKSLLLISYLVNILLEVVKFVYHIINKYEERKSFVVIWCSFFVCFFFNFYLFEIHDLFNCLFIIKHYPFEYLIDTLKSVQNQLWKKCE